MSLSLSVSGSLGVVLAIATGILLVVFVSTRARRVLFRTTQALPGDPRRSRALARIGARGSRERERVVFAFHEANALLWEGDFPRAIALLDARVIPARLPELGVLPIIVKLEALLFDGRAEEARELLAAHAEELLPPTSRRQAVSCDIAAVRGMLAFHEGDLATARARLEEVPALRTAAGSAADPIFRAADFFLAAIAYREQRREAMRAHLGRAISAGGRVFVVGWALTEWSEHLRGEHPPRQRDLPSRPRARAGTSWVRALLLGPAALLLRTRAFTRRPFRTGTVLALLAFDAVVVVALRLVDYTAGARFAAYSLVPMLTPLVTFFVAAHVATGHRREREATLRVLAGFYSALPLLLVISFAATRILDRGAFASAVQAVLGLVALAVFVRLARAAGSASVGRAIAASIVLVVTGLVPLHFSAWHRLFWTPSPRGEVAELTEEDRNQLVFLEVERVQALEARLAPERPGVADLWFVGAAGWADQDVFFHEVASARTLFDTRFDTRGHSLLLANDPVGSEEHPLAATPSLRHVLKAVGARMNTEEDILFLAVTSHGSGAGLALRFPRRSPFDDETLRPEDLRAMLDEAKIRWRVILLLGCHSGVFVPALRDESTLLATASAHDRVSYGCVGGNPFTDYGKAVFDEQLARETSFATAFREAAKVVAAREANAGIAPSLPQVSEGAAIAPKLAALEKRLFPGTPAAE